MLKLLSIIIILGAIFAPIQTKHTLNKSIDELHKVTANLINQRY
jgi:hypothetical protein